MSRKSFPRTGDYGLIHADPPWAFATRGAGDKVPTQGDQPYATLTMEDLITLPVPKAAAPDCVLVMWTTSSHVVQAIDLARAWGFTYKSLGFVWVKTQKGDPTKPKMGMGFWVRQECETTLVFCRGAPKRIDAGVRQMIFEPAREHSRKPEEGYARCERLAAGPYLDLFGRASRPGWTVWGDEATKFDAPAGARPLGVKDAWAAGELADVGDVLADMLPTPRRRSREDLLGL